MRHPATISEALQEGVKALRQARVSEPRLTAGVLLGHILGTDQTFLYAHSDDELTADQWARFRADIGTRCGGTPTQYITGVQEFYGLPFRVTPDVLIPRPETELLVEQTVARAPTGASILDIGTGSGAIALAVQKQLPGCKVFGADISRAALALARENSGRLGLPVSFVQADLAEPFRGQAFEIVVCNPPYLSQSDLGSLQREVRDHEPRIALFAGDDGLEAYRRLSTAVCEVLRPGGWLLIEVGYNTSAAVRPLFGGEDWEEPRIYRDLAGWERVMAYRRAAPPGSSTTFRPPRDGKAC